MEKRIGIITAIDEEFDALKSLLTDAKETEYAHLTFLDGRINDVLVTLAKSGMGKVNAAMCAQILVDKFNSNAIINVGIGGGLANDLKVGELVISTDAIQYDMDSTPLGYRLGEIAELGMVEFPADKKLIESALETANEHDLVARAGRVMSADQFLNNSEIKDFLINEYNGTIVEMEGAAIAHVCYMNNIPYLVIRSVSDSADEEAAEKVNDNSVSSSIKTVDLVTGTIAKYALDD